MNRNTSLEHLTGPRTYIPPPGFLIVELISSDKTKGGLFVPVTSTYRKQPAIGRVVAVGEEKGGLNTGPAPCDVDDVVLFDVTTIPVYPLEEGYATFDWGLVYSVVRLGSKRDGRGLFYEPEGEAVANGGEERVG